MNENQSWQSTATTETKTKFCKYCGEKIDIESVICPKCGKQVEELKTSKPEPPQMGYTVQSQLSTPRKGMATASLIFGILSFIFPLLGLFGIIGIILAITAKDSMKATGTPTGIATAGLVLSIFGLIYNLIAILILVFAIFNIDTVQDIFTYFQ